MNLITDPWLSIIRADGCRERICPWMIAEQDNPVIDIDAPRADFQGALYQFLIGLLQTTFAPQDYDDWHETWEDGFDSEALKKAFLSVEEAFQLFGDGPAFLQDLELSEGEMKPLAGLLIDAPGGKTLKDNLDHFVKGGVVEEVCAPCAASALFTLQTNAPSGGVGHRTGLRGGGPLTTLVLPHDSNAPLWKKLWLNVLTQDEYTMSCDKKSDIFPWLASTRVSDGTGSATLPEDTHSLQMYWGMPRRIRLLATNDSGCCTLCGDHSTNLVGRFITKNYGVNYEGPWLHPLTPYRKDPKHEKPDLSLKGQSGGLGYRHWLGLTLHDSSNGDGAAQVVADWQRKANGGLDQQDRTMRLWCFGFDMDNMKARCWYDHQMPIMAIANEYRENFIALVSSLINPAKEVIALLRGQIKAAWSDHPKDLKGDFSFVDQSFWQTTERHFYQHLNALIKLPASTENLSPAIASQWLCALRDTAFNIFDQWALAGDTENKDMARIIKSRKALFGKFSKIKSVKALAAIAELEKDCAIANEG